jgi:serine protease Do
LQQQYKLPVGSGVLVGSVAANGPAQKAGLRQGDVIVKVNATAIASYDDLLTVLANDQPGNNVTVTVAHTTGQQQTYTVTLGELPASSNGYD